MPNPPHRHHYLPVFYTKRWAIGLDQKLEQFHQPHGPRVKPRRLHPEAVGYVDRLYELQGLEPQLAQQIETQFFKPVDDLAARALAALEEGKKNDAWDDRYRSAWSRFLLSLMLRHPMAVQDLKAEWNRRMLKVTPIEEAAYQRIQTPHQPPTYEEYLQREGGRSIDHGALEQLMKLTDHEDIGRTINNMIWDTITTEPTSYKLLTSDNAVIMTRGLRDEDTALILPIGPHRLFAGTNSLTVMHRLQTGSKGNLVKHVNRVIVSNARTYVYGSDRSQIAFIQKHIGTERIPTLVAQVSAWRSKEGRSRA